LESHAAGDTARPSFLGSLAGELFKIGHLLATWVMAVLLAGFIAAPYLLFAARPGYAAEVRDDPLSFMYFASEVDLSVLRIFGGIALIVLTAMVIGLEYQHGTIRVLLGRGVYRLQLLGAKMLALVGAALAILAAGIALDALLTGAFLLAETGNLSALQSLTPRFWADIRLYLLSVVISMGVTLLLAAAVTVVGRSLAVGLGVGLSWFAADNIGAAMLALVAAFTHSDFWVQVTGYFLGPILNVLPALIVPAHIITVHGAKGITTIAKPAATVGIQPLATIDGRHALAVIGIYALIFAVVAAVLTWRRDVLE
jgi:ABC-type transport system involved in multi-copper enzyme maturation permease subunit